MTRKLSNWERHADFIAQAPFTLYRFHAKTVWSIPFERTISLHRFPIRHQMKTISWENIILFTLWRFHTKMIPFVFVWKRYSVNGAYCILHIGHIAGTSNWRIIPSGDSPDPEESPLPDPDSSWPLLSSTGAPLPDWATSLGWVPCAENWFAVADAPCGAALDAPCGVVAICCFISGTTEKQEEKRKVDSRQYPF